MTQKETSQVLIEVAETPTTIQRQTSQVLIEVAFKPAAETDPPPGPIGAPSSSSSQFEAINREEPLAQWTIDGKAVPMEWSDATMSAPGGYEQMRGRVAIDKMPNGAGQGSVLIARRPNGAVLWYGSILAVPKVKDGVAEFSGVGPVDLLRRRAERLPYQIRGGDQWTDRESEPFSYGNSEKYDLFSKGPAIGWAVDTRSYGVGNKAGYALYAKDWPFRRVAFTIKKSTDNSNFALRLLVGNNLGSLSEDASWTLGAGNPDGTEIAWSIAESADTLALVVDCTGATTPGARAKFWLTNLRVNGRGTSDETTTTDIMHDLAVRCDYDSARIESSSLVAMPLDWEGPWDGLADYIARLDDWTWVVEEDTRLARGGRQYNFYGGLRYSAWGRDGDGEWRGRLSRGIDESLTPLPLYNRVSTYYEFPPGVRQVLTTDVSTVGDLDDPLKASGVVAEWPEPLTLNDGQHTSDLAEAVNEQMLRRISQQRVQGSVMVSQLQYGTPFDIKAGDTLRILDFNPTLPAQRITAVTYQPDGSVQATLGWHPRVTGRRALRLS